MKLYKKSDSSKWWVSIYTRDSDGRSIRIRRSTGTADRKDAEAFAQALAVSLGLSDRGEDAYRRAVSVLAAVYRHNDRQPARVTGLPLSRIVTEYEARKNAVAGKHTKEHFYRMRGDVRKLLTWLKTARPKIALVDEITRTVAADFVGHLSRQKLADLTKKNTVRNLSTVWKTLMVAHDGLTDPWTYVVPKPGAMVHGRPFSPDEQRAIFAAAEAVSPEWLAACKIARYTGLRFGDVAGLRWEEIDIPAGLIRKRPKKTERLDIEVVIPIAPAVLEELEKAREREEEGEPYVIPGIEKYYRMSRKRGVFRDILEAAGIKAERGVSFHSWRHTFRTSLAEAGIPQEVAMKLGGWVSPRTAGIYDHDEHLADLRDAIAAISGKKSPQ